MSRRTLKRFFALTITLIAVTAAAAIPASAATFSDVDANSDLGKAVSLLVDKGIITGMGDGTFGTARGLTRAETCTVINKTFGYTQAGTETFSDVPESYWGYPYIAVGRQAGYIEGVGNNRFSPTSSLTVEQFCVILRKITGSTPNGSVSGSADLKISAWAADAVYACLDAGLMSLDADGHIVSQTVSGNIGDTTTTCSRGDMAMILARYVDSGAAVEPPPLQMQHRDVAAYDWDESLFSYDSTTTMLSYNDPSATVMQGIDVSYYQGTIDWQQVKDSGVQVVIIRCGYRGYGSAGKLCGDTQFQSYIQGASAVGLKIGVYFYATAVNYTEAYAEADYVQSLIEPYKSLITMPVVYDWEIASSTARNASVSADVITQCFYAFSDRITQYGYVPTVYFSKNLGKKLDLTSVGTTDFWLAYHFDFSPDKDTGELPAITTGWNTKINMWQYTSSGICPGIPGNVDRVIAISK